MILVPGPYPALPVTTRGSLGQAPMGVVPYAICQP